jgi:hypothetical protein
MKLFRVFLAVGVLATLVGVGYVSQDKETTGTKMASAAEKFVASLSDEQKTKATFAFDDKERFNWHFIPLQDKEKKSTRKGLPLAEMTDAQREAARALLRAGTSDGGYTKATTIMSLEGILKELEKGGAMVRNPGWYFFTVFGKPSKTGKWGWRVEGHHLALNFTLDGGKIIGATPAFFGANPALVKAGEKKGTRVLADAEELAIDLFKSLDDNQKKAAYLEKLHDEIEQGKSAPNVGEPKGMTYAKMSEKQQATMRKLLEAYANRMPSDIAAVELGQVKEAGYDKIHFAYAGGTEPGKRHTYRIQGPTFVVEFLNVQSDSANNPANHIHSAWRNIKGDFGTAVK